MVLQKKEEYTLYKLAKQYEMPVEFQDFAKEMDFIRFD